MNKIKIMIICGTIALLISCRTKEPIVFEEELDVEMPGTRIPWAIERMDYTEFDYSTIIERLKKGERIGAADLIDDYADNLDAIRIELLGGQKAEVQSIVENMHLLARQVRSKKITDADELLSECMIIDRDIGEVFIEEENGPSTVSSDSYILIEEMKTSIDNVRSILTLLNTDQKKKANLMVNKARSLMKKDAQKSTSWAMDMHAQLDIIEEWLVFHLPEDLE